MKKLTAQGFTLIELLVVIAVLGVLAAGVLVLIDPTDKINSANDAKIESDIGSLGRAAQAYSAAHSGYYPLDIATLVTSGDISNVPVAPSGYTETPYVAATCTASSNSGTSACSTFAVVGNYLSKKYTSASENFFRFESNTGKTCRKSTATTAC